MKTRFLLTLFLALSAYIIFSSRSTGAGFNGLGDLTGSPVSGGTCSGCHSGGNFGGSVTITLRDGSNNPVTSYTPGQNYVLEIDVNNASGSPSGFGSQAVMLTSSNANAGTMGTVITTNTRKLTISGRSYMEQSTVSANGLFQVNWTAPASGTGTISVFAVGNVVSLGGTAGDQVVTNTAQITENVVTAISYNQISYCQNSANPTPTQTGTGGGAYSAGAGLSINSTSGIINLAASTAGNYTVTYTYGGGSTTTTSVTVTAQDAATVSYGASPFCATQTATVSPTVTGVLTGSYTASPAGLNISSSTGVINPSTSSPGTYTVSYTTNGPCPRTVTASVTITAQDVAVISYSGSNFCSSQSLATAIITGVTGGSFSAGGGLNINSSTGAINPSASTPGNYTVSYTTTGSCPRTATTTVSIVSPDTASLSYAGPYCSSQTAAVNPTVTGVLSGTYTAGTGLNIAGGTGIINPSASTVGNYTVRYITSGVCPDTVTAAVNIIPSDNAQFSYNGASFCLTGSDASASTPLSSGGSFSFSPAGLNLNNSNGTITMSGSSVGNYIVTYMTSGVACPDTHTVAVQITAAGNADFNYAQNNYCSSSADPTPTISGISGGTFSSSSGLIINSSSGLVDLSASNPGNYTIYYNVAGSCPASDSTTLTINPLDQASIDYGFNPNFCGNSTQLASPIISGVQNGIFSAQPLGLSINSSTGAISPNNSTVGSYSVEYTTNGICPVTVLANINILAADAAEISFTEASVFFDTDIQDTVYFFFCHTPTQAAIIIGNTGGSFASTDSFVTIDAVTGSIISPFFFWPTAFTYTTNGTCPSVDTFYVQSDCESVKLTENELSQIEVFPNPTFGGSFNIENQGIAAFTTVEIYNSLGQKVQTEAFDFETGRKTLHFKSELVKGSYLVLVKQGDKSRIFRLMYQ